MFNKKNIEVGQKGEDLACDFLEKAGYKIIERNWHYSKNAEIDIIALDNDCIVFVEVKARTNLNYGHPFEAISKTKIQKIKKAISAYLSLSEKSYKDFRFDGIAIIGLKNPIIEHLKNLG